MPTLQAGTFGADMKGGRIPDTAGKWPWGVQMGYTIDSTFTNSLEMALNLLSQNGEARIVAEPKMLAQDRQSAVMAVMSEEYYMMTPPAGQAGGFFNGLSQLEKIESGTRLSIVPRIGDNNDITMRMAVEVSDSIPSARATALPVVTRRTAEDVVRVKDGGTAVVAGLTQSTTRTENQQVPGLSGLPLLGPLFKNKNFEQSSKEVAIFITASIVHEDSDISTFGNETPSVGATSATSPASEQAGEGEDFKTSLRESMSRQYK